MITVVKYISGFMILALGGYLVWWFGASLLGWFLRLPPTTITAVAGVSGLVSVPIVTYFTTRSLERRRSMENAIREQKTQLYDKLTRGLMRMLNLKKSEPKMQPDEMMEFLAEMTPPLISYGSRGVIRQWNGFRKVSREQLDSPLAIMFAFEDLLKAMRQDLGHRVFGHQRGELLGIFINDIDEFKKSEFQKRKVALSTPAAAQPTRS